MKPEEISLKTKNAIERVENEKDLVGPFDTVEEAMKYLNTDD